MVAAAPSAGRLEEIRPDLPGHGQCCHCRAGLAGFPCQSNTNVQLLTQGKIFLPPVTCEREEFKRKPGGFAHMFTHRTTNTYTYLYLWSATC